jgi:hypothetical protein
LDEDICGNRPFLEVGLGDLTSSATGIPPEELINFESAALIAEQQKLWKWSDPTRSFVIIRD